MRHLNANPSTKALIRARGLISTPFVSGPGRVGFNGWVLAARCYGGKAPTFAPGWGPRDRAEAEAFFTSRGMVRIPDWAAEPGDALLFDMGADGHHVAVMADITGPEPRMISCQWARAAGQSWMGAMWRARLVGVFACGDDRPAARMAA